ncbi:MAG: divalent-cation tolerance protein CutA [Deltaproteobacteria bacterium]|nr:divalent-cation tolerance protein CutA [Deltaproteobacteria bacterium]
MLVFTTLAKKSDANKIARTLLEKKLAACVSVLPQIESHYVWQGKLCHEKEFLLLIKTLKSQYQELEALLLEIHPYDCPEIFALSFEEVSPAYLKWLQGSVQS